jgi:hypothetical protein
MKKQNYEVIIVGAGISGLSAAYKLKKNNVDILVISEDIGGRIVGSKDEKVQYGAYYAMDIYEYVKEFITFGKKIKLSDQILHKRNKGYTLFSLCNFKYILQAIKFYFLLRKFKKHFLVFHKQCLGISQLEALEKDPYLFDLYNKNAFDFAKEQGVKDFSIHFVEEALHATTFSEVKKLNAFTYLQFSLPLIVPIYEFIFEKEKMIEPFRNDISFDTVLGIKKVADLYEVKTHKHIYFAKNVIVATPSIVSQKLLYLPDIKGSACAHMFHVTGDLKQKWNQGNYDLFSDENSMFTIAKTSDNSFLFYTKNEKPNFDMFFSEYKIIIHKFWNPAFNIEGSVLWKTNLDDGLFLIGDHNVCGMEDSCITGLYAANKIIDQLKK